MTRQQLSRVLERIQLARDVASIKADGCDAQAIRYPTQAARYQAAAMDARTEAADWESLAAFFRAHAIERGANARTAFTNAELADLDQLAQWMLDGKAFSYDTRTGDLIKRLIGA